MVSISECGKLRKFISKSRFLHCLESLGEVKYDVSVLFKKVVYGGAFINMNAPK